VTRRLPFLRLALIQFGAVGVGLILAALCLTAIGKPPFNALWTLLDGAFGSSFALTQTVLKAIPLALTGLAVAVPLRLNLWNIGGEGQFHAGAIGASWVALTFASWPSGALLPAMVVGALVAGAVWAALAAVPRAFMGVNEIITTLLLNYVAILTVDYLVTGPWRSKSLESFNLPVSNPFSEHAILPNIGDSQVHIGVFFPLAAALLLTFALGRTVWGFEVRMVGSSAAAARVAGLPIARTIVSSMMVAGAVAGLAGMIEVANTFGRIRQGISPGYGYMAIVIAALAGGGIFGTLLVSFMFGGFIVGGLALETLGVPNSFVLLLQGIILFCALAGAKIAGSPLRLPSPRRAFAGRTKEEPSAP
jgi:ABC-type uncharacterized transport system permease subunit